MLAQVFALLVWEEVVRLELEGATGREEGKEVGGRGDWEGIGEELGVFEGLEATGEEEER